MASALQRFANVRRDEIPAVLASVAYFLFVLAALQVIRPAREALGMRSGLDAVRWLFVGTAVVTLAVNPLFGALVSKFRRFSFIAATYGFFAASLLMFWALLTLMVARFSLEQSKRLFGLIAVGGTLGAMLGPWLAWRYAEVWGAQNLLLVAVGFLGLATLAARVVVGLRPESQGDRTSAPPALEKDAIIGGSAWDGLRDVFRSPYLVGICAFVLVMTVMATFIYFTRLAMVAAMTEAVDERTGLFAQIDFWTQFTTFLLQLLVTGHVMKRLGVGVALALLPVVVSLGFIGLAVSGSFAALVILEATYRATQRGLTRPARETLFTVVRREDKYKAKSVIDTFVYRTGDVVGAWTEGLLGALGYGVTALAAVVVPTSAAWAALGLWLARQQTKAAAARGVDGATP